MAERQLMLGSEALALGVKLCRPQVIAAYPITPQTHIVECLAHMVEEGELSPCRLVTVESELSGISLVLGASAGGARVFTATASQGLALMHEILHWVAGMRFPVVLANANRALGGPWILYMDQTDSLSQRDTGWVQIYSANAQEALDMVPLAYRIAEAHLLPVMVVMDGFWISHTLEPIEAPGQEEIDRFLPPRKDELQLDLTNPQALGAPTSSTTFYTIKKGIQEEMENLLRAFTEYAQEYTSFTGRGYNTVETWDMEDAQIALAGLGGITGTARHTAKLLRREGIKAGVIFPRLLRPFPEEEIRKALEGVEIVLVMNRSLSPGMGGQLTQELKTALYHLDSPPQVVDWLAGLGGVDPTPEAIKGAVTKALKGEKRIWSRKPTGPQR
jgi:pyruvate/2-oxoacid:ferredoxin oxidoreductase alpha subunit